MFVQYCHYVSFELHHYLHNPATANLYSPFNSSILSIPMAPWVTEQFLAILNGLTETYMQKKGSDRKEVVDRAVLDISKAAEKDQKAVPPGLDKV
jgi:hypothetical protein